MTEAIAGKLDGGKPSSCAAKEADEEAGARVWNLRQVFHCFMSPGAVTERLHLFIADYDSTVHRTQSGGNKAEGEDIEVLEVSLDAAIEMTVSGEIVDAKTIMLLQWAALNVLRASMLRFCCRFWTTNHFKKLLKDFTEIAVPTR